MKKLILSVILVLSGVAQAAPIEFCTIHARMGERIAKMRDMYVPQFLVTTYLMHDIGKLPKDQNTPFLRNHVRNLITDVYNDRDLASLQGSQIYTKLYNVCLSAEIEAYE